MTVKVYNILKLCIFYETAQVSKGFIVAALTIMSNLQSRFKTKNRQQQNQNTRVDRNG